MKTKKKKELLMNKKRLIYGTMGLGGGWDKKKLSQKDINQGLEIFEYIINAGIHVLDFADIYQGGKSERIFGSFIKKNPSIREKLFLQSKVGIILDEDPKNNHYNFSREHLINSVEGILNRMHISSLDRLFLHRFDPIMNPDELKESISFMRKKGYFKSLGVSNMSYHQIKLIEDITGEKITANQLEMSLGKRDFVEGNIMFNHLNHHQNDFPVGTLEYCQRHNIQLQAWGSLAQGVYSGRDLGENPDEHIVKTRRLIKKIAQTKETSMEAIVISWLLKHNAKICPVIGTTNINRIEKILMAEKINLSRKEWYDIFVTARGRIVP